MSINSSSVASNYAFLWGLPLYITTILTLGAQALKTVKTRNFDGVSSITIVVGVLTSLIEIAVAYTSDTPIFWISKTLNLIFSATIFATWVIYAKPQSFLHDVAGIFKRSTRV